MRYVPIYLRQGLVVLSLTSETFLLLLLPLYDPSWRIGREWTRDLTPHHPWCSCGSCGRLILIGRSYFGFFLCGWPRFGVDQWTLFFLGPKGELLFLAIDVKADFSCPHIYVCSSSAQEWLPKNQWHFFWYFHVENYDVNRDEVVSDSEWNIFSDSLWTANWRVY